MSIVGFTDGDAENGDGPREYVTSEATAPLINAQEFVQTPVLCCVPLFSVLGSTLCPGSHLRGYRLGASEGQGNLSRT